MGLRGGGLLRAALLPAAAPEAASGGDESMADADAATGSCSLVQVRRVCVWIQGQQLKQACLVQMMLVDDAEFSNCLLLY